MAIERRFDLAQLDTMPLNLDLSVFPAQELDIAIGQPTAQIASAIQTLAGQRVSEEAPGTQGFIAPIALGQTDTADIQLTGHPRRANLQRIIQHIEALVIQRFAVGNAAPVGIDLLQRIQYRPDGRLGRPAQADKLQRRLQRPGAFG